MSDYRDIVREAIDKGFYLDSCGDPDRHYTWGSWIDLCGMSVEDANPANWEGDSGGGQGGGSDTAKTKNTITFLMQKGSDSEYTLYLNAEKAPNEDVVVSFNMDDEPHIVTIPAGTTSLNTGLKGKVANKPYAVITSTAASSEDEQYDYKTKNNVKTGVFALTIDNNGVKTTQQVQYGEEVALPSAQDREGYDFVWTDGNGAVITGGTYTMPESNATITGKYVAKSYVLTYTVKEEVLNGDTVSESVISTATATTKFGTVIWNTIKNLTPAKTGYTLDGWKSEDGAVNSATKMPAKDFAVENVYRLNKYTLTFKADGETVYSEQIYFGHAITAPEIPAKTGYEIIGWNAEVPATMPAANKTFTAVYSAITYYIRYYVDGSEMTGYTESHIYGDTISIRANETKEGHTFSGWEPSTLPSTMPAHDVDIAGTFTVNTYHFKLLVDGETYFEADYEYGEPIDKAAILDPEKEGYTFTGWEPEIPDYVPANDMEISAQFTINQYTVKYYVDGEDYSSVTYDYGAAVTPIAEPEKEGYTFSGWGEHPETMPAHDVDIAGTFTINEYTLAYYVDGDAYTSLTIEYAAAITPVAEPEKEGYTFSGWDEVPATMPAHDVDVNGTFIVNTWEIRYFVDGESYITEEHDFGESISIASDPDDRTGYTFSGWTYDEFPDTMPNHDIEVFGEFIVNQYTLSFVLDGEPYTSLTLDYGEEIEAPEVPDVTGYTFSGWSPEVPDTVPAEDMTFSGTMVINVWTATYYIDGAEYSSVTYEYGEQIVYPDVPKEGFILKWDREYETMPDNDVDINGIYEEFVESNMIYYGSVNANLPKSMSTSGMLSYENEDGVQIGKIFTIKADPRYAELETDEQFDQWDIDEMYDFNILVPASMSVEVLDAGKNPLGGLHVAMTDDIEGTTYKLYSAPFAVAIDTDINMTIYITATKN